MDKKAKTITGFKVLNECAQLAAIHGVARVDYLIGPYTGRALAPRSDEFVLAIDSDRVTLTQAARAIHTLNDAGLPAAALKLVWVNRLGTPTDIGQTAIRSLLGREPAMSIGLAAEAMTHALELGQPLVLSQPDHPAAAQLRILASSLMNPAS